MNPPAKAQADVAIARKKRLRAVLTQYSALVIVTGILGFVLWAHLGSGVRVFRSQVTAEPGWEAFRAQYGIAYFGEDGQFVRAVQNGYNLVYYTHRHASRFTRKSATDRPNACADCHTAEDLAFSFVNSDRFDAKLGRRMSFEDQVRRCYAGAMDGFAPTVYDPAVRDIRLLARAVAHHLQLGEGALGTDPTACRGENEGEGCFERKEHASTGSAIQADSPRVGVVHP